MNHLETLTLKLVDRTISERELTELEQLTQQREERRAFVQLMELESLLRSSNRSSVEDRVLDQIHGVRLDRVEKGVMRAISEPKSRWQRMAHPQSIIAGLTVLACCIACIFYFTQQPRVDHEPIARFYAHGSISEVVDANGNVRSVTASGQPLAIYPDDTIKTSRAIDIAEVVYRDGTKLELLGETTVKLLDNGTRSKQLNIVSGLVQADVETQPKGYPLQIVTQSATLEVLGTTMGVEVRETSTQLEVATGRVAMTRVSDGQKIEVSAGRYATVSDRTTEPLQAFPFPELPLSWSEEFDEQLPQGWRTGALSKTETPSCFAVESVPTDNGRFSITTHNAWQEGDHALCEINDSSFLHLRIRQSRFARITVMVGTRAYPPAKGRLGGNLFYTKKAWNEDLPPDTWKTISIPLRDVSWQMKQGERINGPVKLTDVAAYLIHISTMQNDIDLTVDRIWISNDLEEPTL